MILSSFIFNSKFNQQIKDSPAGTICAPAYINIFVSELEEKLIYLLITDESISYVRFINDILGDGLHERRNYILHKKNKWKKYSIKFDSKCSKEKIELLGTLVYKEHNNHLQTTLYKKPIDRQIYLHAKCILYKKKIATTTFGSTYTKEKNRDPVSRKIYTERISRKS